MSRSEREKFEDVFPVPKNVEWNPEWCGSGRYEPVNSLLERDTPEYADIQNQRWIGWQAAREHPTETPAARWRENGNADPCGENTYNCERAKLCKGHLTDDELANEVFLYNHRQGHESIAYLTAAKERIRWLSRKLVEANSQGESEYPNCDTCGASMDYMPWHYSEGGKKHLHACDKCWWSEIPAQAGAALQAKILIGRIVEELENGFVACKRCGDQEDTATLDCMSDLKKLKELLAMSGSAPEGWKPVPERASEAMLDAGRLAGVPGLITCRDAATVWHAMLEAAPNREQANG